MRIKRLQLTHFKAFLGTYTVEVGGKNLFIYGENGSGKSSLYYALKDFFQSSMEPIELQSLANVFASTEEREKVGMEVVFETGLPSDRQEETFFWNQETVTSRNPEDPRICDGNKLKSFLTYKHLLDIHHLKHHQTINLFNLLVKGVLQHFQYTLTQGSTLGELWNQVQFALDKPTGRDYPVRAKRSDVQRAIGLFNDAFGELFKPESPENILKHARPILAKFQQQLDLDLHFPLVKANEDLTGVEGALVQPSLKFCGKAVVKPHMFLNEARLSAIAISLYLGMIKRHVQGIACKILFLDDIFIGLDIGNRLPLLEILSTDFADYQVFITTYDKPWFEFAKGHLNSSWKTLEFYAKTNADGIPIPVILDGSDLLARADKHLENCDYKAAAVYTRSAFEKMLKDYCDKKGKLVRYRKNTKSYTSENFWVALKDDLSPECVAAIEQYRSLVLNALSHYNSERHEIRQEVQGAIGAVRQLKTELNRQR